MVIQTQRVFMIVEGYCSCKKLFSKDGIVPLNGKCYSANVAIVPINGIMQVTGGIIYVYNSESSCKKMGTI